MKPEFGKYYLLNTDKYYYCTDIGRQIKFMGTLAVKCSSSLGNNAHFGELIDTSNPNGPDYETNNDIVFSDDDVISEYKRKDMPLLYMDFPYESK